MGESNAGVLSTRPHSFSVQGELGGRLLYITLRPCEPSGPVKLELETFLALPCVEQSDTTMELGMVPCGSGASARAISRHCAPPGQVAEGAPHNLAARVAVLRLVLSVKSLSPVSDDDRATTSSANETVPPDASQDGDGPAIHRPPVHSRTSVGNQSDGRVKDWLSAELQGVRTELQVQQTLMTFQERRLQAFEKTGSCAETAADGLKASVQVQQEEFQKLRVDLQRQQASQQHVLWQAQLRFQADIDQRDRRIAKLQQELREKDRQLERMAEEGDSIWRMPPTRVERPVTYSRTSLGRTSQPQVFEDSFHHRYGEYSTDTHQTE